MVNPTVSFSSPLPHVSLISRPIWHLPPSLPPPSPGDLWLLPGQKERRGHRSIFFQDRRGEKIWEKRRRPKKSKTSSSYITNLAATDRIFPPSTLCGPREKGFAEKKQFGHDSVSRTIFARRFELYAKSSCEFVRTTILPSLWNDFSALISAFLCWCMERGSLPPPKTTFPKQTL